VNNEFWTAMPSVTYHGASPRLVLSACYSSLPGSQT